MLRRILIVTAVFAMSFGTAFADGDGDPVARLQNYLDKTTSLRASFQSRLLDEARRPVAESSGTVALKRSGLFRWEYNDPAPSLIVGDGRQVWSFDPELEQAVVRDLDVENRANPSLLLGGEARLGEEFDVTGSYLADDIDWIELAPRQAQSDFVLIRLGFSGEKLSLMELVDQLDQVTQIEFTELEQNPELDDQLFVFEPPEGVDVVGTAR